MSRGENYAYEKGASGRAWMPGKGRGSLTLAYQNNNVSDALMSTDVTGRRFPGGYVGDGTRVYHGEITDQTGVLEADYGISERFAASGSIAYVGSKYEGAGGHPALPGREFIDNGEYHPQFQDAALGVRYLAVSKPLAVIPFVRFSFPTRDYVNVGHSAVGRNLNQLQLGANLARTLDPILPDAYAKATLGYAFVESPHNHGDPGGPATVDQHFNINRRFLSLELGYFVTRRLAANAFVNNIHTEGGIDWARDLRSPADYARIGHVHDAAARDRHTTVGGGLSFEVIGNFWLYAGYSGIVSGQNVHGGQAFSIATTWSFNTRKPPPPGP
ncbi:MAG TPA: hypothetical protein VFM88_07955 [Vicinamibacteria bacterium]|nr:hypothetical protein [Vicinamibacteria bacterium]